MKARQVCAAVPRLAALHTPFSREAERSGAEPSDPSATAHALWQLEIGYPQENWRRGSWCALPEIVLLVPAYKTTSPLSPETHVAEQAKH